MTTGNGVDLEMFGVFECDFFDAVMGDKDVFTTIDYDGWGGEIFEHVVVGAVEDDFFHGGVVGLEGFEMAVDFGGEFVHGASGGDVFDFFGTEDWWGDED